MRNERSEVNDGESGCECNESEYEDEGGDGHGQELNELSCSHWWEGWQAEEQKENERKKKNRKILWESVAEISFASFVAISALFWPFRLFFGTCGSFNFFGW